MQATRWMRAAQAVVFVGTSFAVHVTRRGLDAAHRVLLIAADCL
jgi:hypothetical protein